ncbi:hypothetical protein TNCT_116561 [Trichonephila clavata]|uniref:Uncharacterized protein n=1 Tax=Trichonephila clavata TaxID=2740835 RepID=A0A8X6I737_TRICU|nr:hypothetical protein TNCT_116561 [Trichonephila clavata]
MLKLLVNSKSFKLKLRKLIYISATHPSNTRLFSYRLVPSSEKKENILGILGIPRERRRQKHLRRIKSVASSESPANVPKNKNKTPSLPPRRRPQNRTECSKGRTPSPYSRSLFRVFVWGVCYSRWSERGDEEEPERLTGDRLLFRNDLGWKLSTPIIVWLPFFSFFLEEKEFKS